jgi:tRNA-(ms[2]io[6]A)-hydroxylase
MLGLKVESDAAWAAEAMRDLDRVLVDHAHCEMKAASNALSLATRHSDDLTMVQALTEIAREEIEHFQRVLGVLAKRGLALGAPPVDPYAAELRRAASVSGTALAPLVERLLVGALIEARSCERFKLLAAALDAAGEREISVFYTELLAAEARHFRTFVDLAVTAAGGPSTRDAVTARLELLAEREGEIVRSLARGGDRAAIHG